MVRAPHCLYIDRLDREWSNMGGSLSMSMCCRKIGWILVPRLRTGKGYEIEIENGWIWFYGNKMISVVRSVQWSVYLWENWHLCSWWVGTYGQSLTIHLPFRPSCTLLSLFFLFWGKNNLLYKFPWREHIAMLYSSLLHILTREEI